MPKSKEIDSVRAILKKKDADPQIKSVAAVLDVMWDECNRMKETLKQLEDRIDEHEKMTAHAHHAHA